jgi:hypothetical protein
MAGEDKLIKLKIDNVYKEYDGRNGKTVALNVLIWKSLKMSLSALLGHQAAVNQHC